MKIATTSKEVDKMLEDPYEANPGTHSVDHHPPPLAPKPRYKKKVYAFTNMFFALSLFGFIWFVKHRYLLIKMRKILDGSDQYVRKFLPLAGLLLKKHSKFDTFNGK